MTIFESLQQVLYTYILPQGNAISTVAVDLVCLVASLFVIALPFLIVWKIIKLIMGV